MATIGWSSPSSTAAEGLAEVWSIQPWIPLLHHAAMYLSWMALECRALAYYSTSIIVV